MDQQTFLQLLFDNFGFTRLERNVYLTREVGRDIKYLDELRSHEASRLIDELRERRDRGKNPREED